MLLLSILLLLLGLLGWGIYRGYLFFVVVVVVVVIVVVVAAVVVFLLLLLLLRSSPVSPKRHGKPGTHLKFDL